MVPGLMRDESADGLAKRATPLRRIRKRRGGRLRASLGVRKRKLDSERLEEMSGNAHLFWQRADDGCSTCVERPSRSSELQPVWIAGTLVGKPAGRRPAAVQQMDEARSSTLKRFFSEGL